MCRIALLILVVTGFSAGGLKAQTRATESIRIDDDLQLVRLEDSLYIHISWHTLPAYGRIPSNGMLLIRNGEALMIDTPMDDEKTERLVRYIRDSLNARVSTLLIGHSHDDCMGGLGWLQTTGVKSIANQRTVDICREEGLPVPSHSFDQKMELAFHGEWLECRYFGPGHAADNITVWFPGRKILFGGCLVKSAEAGTLNPVQGSDPERWGETVGKVMTQYPDIRQVIPGHGPFGGIELLLHTMALAN